jgi:hypothetical protein
MMIRRRGLELENRRIIDETLGTIMK